VHQVWSRLLAVLSVALSHSGVCNNIPRTIVYAPLKNQGLGVPDIYIEQGVMKLLRLIKYGRKSKYLTSCLIRHNCEAMKMELGLNGYLFQHDPTIWDQTVSSTWLKWTWNLPNNTASICGMTFQTSNLREYTTNC
jgi:hypothetical protein